MFLIFDRQESVRKKKKLSPFSDTFSYFLFFKNKSHLKEIIVILFCFDQQESLRRKNTNTFCP